MRLFKGVSGQEEVDHWRRHAQRYYGYKNSLRHHRVDLLGILDWNAWLSNRDHRRVVTRWLARARDNKKDRKKELEKGNLKRVPGWGATTITTQYALAFPSVLIIAHLGFLVKHRTKELIPTH